MKKELEILFERNKREFAFFKEEANKIGVASKWGTRCDSTLFNSIIS